MYRCALCEVAVSAKVRSLKRVVESKPVVYPRREGVNRVIVRGKVHWNDDPGGQGSRIVREVLVCRACAEGEEAAPG
jgi:hypothetical protein